MPEGTKSRYVVQAGWNDVPHLDEQTMAELLEIIAENVVSGRSVLIRTDSMMVVTQLNGVRRAKKGMYIEQYRRGAAALEACDQKGILVDIVWVPREQNEEADRLTR